MTEQAYLVLLALSPEPLHGYAVIGAVRDLTDGATVLGAASLYGALDRLTAAGLVEPAGEAVVDGRVRRYYRVTEAGHRAAQQETERLRALAARAERTLRGDRPTGPGALGDLAGSPA
ncbi:PadR family transcriptional regulator [Xylanimonas oleitrophica]|uniref:PadR family transcriptional regulator n=2 Tax=Xylanimonas oleitrophica TaxID=2607479 RepID=A0A2W5WRI2_9MICO|nr:PadR family transcriptional regulator [Xylanimonas oleitrophica]